MTSVTPPEEPAGLLPSAPKLRFMPGLAWFVPSCVVLLLLMANYGHVHGGVAIGTLACLCATLSLLDILGSFEPTNEMTCVESTPNLDRYLVSTVVGFGLFVVVTRLSVAGNLPGGLWTAALLIPALLIFTVTMLYRTVDALGVFGNGGAPFWRHPSLWLVGVTIGIYAPMLGSFSLVDPWETHYGEVAREMIARDDWISLWWAQDGWFWSKPILDFWLQALSFSVFDVGTAPDTMLGAVTLGRIPYPEWAARLPILLCSLLGQSLLYAGVARTWGRRAALVGSLLLVAVPYYSILAHQSMTDLPYIACLMAAMGLFLLGFFCPADKLIEGYAVTLGRRRLVLSAHALIIGAVILLALPQIAYLLSRNLGLVTAGNDLGFFPHLDRFFSGSGGGNCGLPGNEACASQFPVHSRPQPATSGFFWAFLLGVFLFINRGERRRQRLCYLAAWLMLALSFMAKGLPGPVIAVASLGAALTFMRRWSDFERLELPSGLLIFAVVAMPWFVQMTVRHGPAFLERLFIHDMYKRAFVHVHDTNTGDDTSIGYYLWQLGYGLFPATGVVALTSLGAFFGRGEHKDRKQATATFLGTWFLVGFAMFSLTLTKFHHYAIAIVPPLLSGRVLAAVLGDTNWSTSLLRRPAAPNVRRRDLLATDPSQRLLLVISAVSITWFVGVDLFTVKAPGGPMRLINLVTYNYARTWPQNLALERAIQLTTLATIACLLGWVGPRRIRAFSVMLLLAVCLGFAAWTCNVYLPRIAPHWGQRDTIVEYYRRRHGPEEMLVSYQMNWKGENFYTGNRTPAFITTGETFKKFIDEQRAAKHTTLFFTLEPGRVGNLRNDLGKVARLDVLTDARLNNKFTLVRVEL